MTSFGDRDTFAIEAQFQEIYGTWVYGALRFWVAGTPIGNFEDTSDLAIGARFGRTFLQASARRTRPDLDVMEPAEVYQLLYGRYVVDLTMPGALTSPPNSELWHWDTKPYVLDEVGESALRDKFAVIAVRRGDGRDRLIVKDFARDAICHVELPPGECDRTIVAYCEWAEGLPDTADPR